MCKQDKIALLRPYANESSGRFAGVVLAKASPIVPAE